MLSSHPWSGSERINLLVPPASKRATWSYKTVAMKCVEFVNYFSSDLVKYKERRSVPISKSIYKRTPRPNMTCQGYSFANFVLLFIIILSLP